MQVVSVSIPSIRTSYMHLNRLFNCMQRAKKLGGLECFRDEQCKSSKCALTPGMNNGFCTVGSSGHVRTAYVALHDTWRTYIQGSINVTDI
jgi:hypothetical protein